LPPLFLARHPDSALLDDEEPPPLLPLFDDVLAYHVSLLSEVLYERAHLQVGEVLKEGDLPDGGLCRLCHEVKRLT
jgi:hypothetical protein